jgi:NAD-dependent deacetylase
MKQRKKIVVLSGAGISAESGIATFRDSNGLWENHRIEDVATPQGWQKNRELVLDFYNQRRKQAIEVQPNAGHCALAKLEKYYDMTIVTQNVDGLHEKAGSTHVMHLHGELSKSRSSVDESLIYDIEGWEIKLGDRCEKGSQLRPHIVWFGEAVPMMEEAIDIALSADIFIVVGTSLVVYPAAGLVDFIPETVPIYVVDPNLPEVKKRPNLTLIGEPASIGMTQLADKLIADLARD